MESAHRFAWEQVHGPIPDGLHVDHKEHCDPACCNVEHLRLATPSQNASNRLGPQSNNRTGIRNVSRHKNRWRVQIYKDGKRRFNKSFDSLADAAEAAEEERNRIFGSFAGQL
ncbi:MAG TPA: HNH endonuclease signature motif containing protein [Beutenbergiaceae bacterium]|nr:HNH endonuclease signature motif containing protein [Beutenbergiaceae bacterium]